MLKVEESEVYRYLGYKGEIPEEGIRALVSSALRELTPLLMPRSTHRMFPLHWEEGMPVIEGMPIKSRSLTRSLTGCTSACLFAATIGLAPDRLVQRALAQKKASQGVILQACGAALIEAWCDEVNEGIKEEAHRLGLYPRPRFSPGYGDFPLSYQRDIFQMLQVPGRTGITLTESLMMMPTKSVTAIIGLSPTNENCILSGCEICAKAKTCAFRRT